MLLFRRGKVSTTGVKNIWESVIVKELGLAHMARLTHTYFNAFDTHAMNWHIGWSMGGTIDVAALHAAVPTSKHTPDLIGYATVDMDISDIHARLTAEGHAAAPHVKSFVTFNAHHTGSITCMGMRATEIMDEVVARIKTMVAPFVSSSNDAVVSSGAAQSTPAPTGKGKRVRVAVTSSDSSPESSQEMSRVVDIASKTPLRKRRRDARLVESKTTSMNDECIITGMIPKE
jgi:hypothetical protein